MVFELLIFELSNLKFERSTSGSLLCVLGTTSVICSSIFVLIFSSLSRFLSLFFFVLPPLHSPRMASQRIRAQNLVVSCKDEYLPRSSSASNLIIYLLLRVDHTFLPSMKVSKKLKIKVRCKTLHIVLPDQL